MPMVDADALGGLLDAAPTLTDRLGVLFDLPGSYNPNLRRFTVDIAEHQDEIDEAGRYCDGNGLYLVDPSGARRWVQRLVIGGKSYALGLGSYALVSLAEAREQALSNRNCAARVGFRRFAAVAASGSNRGNHLRHSLRDAPS